jgi:hypothetical protein
MDFSMNRLIRIPALVLALAVSCLFAGAARADATFEVSGIHVDASGRSTAEARSTAVAGGRAAAWSALYRRLTRQQDWGRQPVLDGNVLGRLITAYVPFSERRSTTRYVAEMTYIFNPDAVARVLQSAGIPYTAVAVRRILLIPMAPGFSRGSPWTAAFASPRFANAPVPFALPTGDAQDMGVLAGLNFDTASWDQVAPAANRIRASEAALVSAVVVGNKLQITIKRVGQGVIPSRATVEVPLLQGAASTYPGAADAVVRAIDEMWKSQHAVDASQRAKLTADVHIDSLVQFATLENTIAGVPNVTQLNVAAMDVGEARLTITYIGTSDQLRAALAQVGVTLTGQGGAWQIKPAAGAGQP